MRPLRRTFTKPFTLFFISGSNKVDTAVVQIVGSKFRQNFDNITPEV